MSIVSGIPDSSALFLFHKQKFWNSLYGAIRGHRRSLKLGGGGGYIQRDLYRFKISYISVLIKIHLEFTRVFMLQNVVKNQFSTS